MCRGRRGGARGHGRRRPARKRRGRRGAATRRREPGAVRLRGARRRRALGAARHAWHAERGAALPVRRALRAAARPRGRHRPLAHAGAEPSRRSTPAPPHTPMPTPTPWRASLELLPLAPGARWAGRVTHARLLAHGPRVGCAGGGQAGDALLLNAPGRPAGGGLPRAGGAGRFRHRVRRQRAPRRLRCGRLPRRVRGADARVCRRPRGSNTRLAAEATRSLRAAPPVRPLTPASPVLLGTAPPRCCAT